MHLLWWDPSSSQLSSISQVENNEARRVAGPGQGHRGADISQAWDLASWQVRCRIPGGRKWLVTVTLSLPPRTQRLREK